MMRLEFATWGSKPKPAELELPLLNPDKMFFGNTIVVNGNTWPFHTVEQRRYRFRLLNGCNSRFLILDFGEIPEVEVWMIGSEGGFLAEPVNMTAVNSNRILLGPAERADIIVDFMKVPVGQYVLKNVGPDEPFGGGVPGANFPVSDPQTTGRIMQFHVGPALAPDPTTPPEHLLLPLTAQIPTDTFTRRLALLEKTSSTFDDVPVEALLGSVIGNPETGPAGWAERRWEDPVTENPPVGSTEIWELYNITEDAHPMHIHAVSFELIDRQPILVDDENKTVQLAPGSEPIPPNPWELGPKDTFIAFPEQATRVRMTFTKAGQYVWHCHILEHEDNDMMAPYRIGYIQRHQP